MIIAEMSASLAGSTIAAKGVGKRQFQRSEAFANAGWVGVRISASGESFGPRESAMSMILFAKSSSPAQGNNKLKPIQHNLL